jgi:hypothetical protein
MISFQAFSALFENPILMTAVIVVGSLLIGSVFGWYICDLFLGDRDFL